MRERWASSRQEAHESLVVEMEWLEDRWRCACQTKAVYRGLLAQIRAKDSCALSAFSYLCICLFTLQSKSGTCGDSLQGLKTGRVAWRTRLALFYCRNSYLLSLISGSDLGSRAATLMPQRSLPSPHLSPHFSARRSHPSGESPMPATRPSSACRPAIELP